MNYFCVARGFGQLNVKLDTQNLLDVSYFNLIFRLFPFFFKTITSIFWNKIPEILTSLFMQLIISLGQIPGFRVAVSEGKLILTAKFVLHKGRSDLYSQQQCLKMPVSPHIHQYWLLSPFNLCQFGNQKIFSSCISNMIRDFEHFFLSLQAMGMYVSVCFSW